MNLQQPHFKFIKHTASEGQRRNSKQRRDSTQRCGRGSLRRWSCWSSQLRDFWAAQNGLFVDTFFCILVPAAGIFISLDKQQ